MRLPQTGFGTSERRIRENPDEVLKMVRATPRGLMFTWEEKHRDEILDLIAYIAHPPEILGHSNDQHARLLAAVRRRDTPGATQLMAEHLLGTEHVLAGLLPD